MAKTTKTVVTREELTIDHIATLEHHGWSRKESRSGEIRNCLFFTFIYLLYSADMIVLSLTRGRWEHSRYHRFSGYRRVAGGMSVQQLAVHLSSLVQ